MTKSTYSGVHRALRAARGSAVGRPCEGPDCDRLATGWGLIGHPTTFGMNGDKSVRWSNDLDAYAPLCTRHNSQRDRGGSWTLCPRGHARIAWGADRGGNCRGCVRERAREYYAKTSRRMAGNHAQQGTITEQNGGQS